MNKYFLLKTPHTKLTSFLYDVEVDVAVEVEVAVAVEVYIIPKEVNDGDEVMEVGFWNIRGRRLEIFLVELHPRA